MNNLLQFRTEFHAFLIQRHGELLAPVPQSNKQKMQSLDMKSVRDFVSVARSWVEYHDGVYSTATNDPFRYLPNGNMVQATDPTNVSYGFHTLGNRYVRYIYPWMIEHGLPEDWDEIKQDKASEKPLIGLSQALWKLTQVQDMVFQQTKMIDGLTKEIQALSKQGGTLVTPLTAAASPVGTSTSSSTSG